MSIVNFIFSTFCEAVGFFVVYLSLSCVFEYFNNIKKTETRKFVLYMHFKECCNSLLVAVFSRILVNNFILYVSPYSLYFTTHDYTIKWGIVNVVCMLFTYDTLFYFFHRALHTRYLYKRFHKHHHFLETSSFSTTITSNLEIFANVLFLHLPKLVMPFNNYLHTVVLFIITVFSLMSHDSYFDVFNHQKHHEKSNVNYSTFLPFWDFILSTRYVENTEKIHAPIKKKKLK